MQRLLLVALAGCNSLYGLEATRLVDAPPPDGPPRCPEVGTLPQFRSSPIPVDIIDPPTHYTLDARGTIAVGGYGQDLVWGSPDQADHAVVVFDSPPVYPQQQVYAPRLSPEGDELYMRYTEYQPGGQLVEHRRYRFANGRVDQHAVVKMDLSLTSGAETSPPTARGALPRRMIVTDIGKLFEIEETAPDAWTLVREQVPEDLGVETFAHPAISADGLRLVAHAQYKFVPTLHYFDRASLADPFVSRGVIYTLIGNGVAYYPYLTPDCRRLYFLANPGVHYVEQ